MGIESGQACTCDEAALAQALYDALRETAPRGAMVVGDWAKGTVCIDGSFVLLDVAKSILREHVASKNRNVL